jgi:hypothetical protein
MIPRRRDLLALVLLVALAGAARAPRAAETDSFSEAERMLFTVDHFKTLKAPAQLDYEYRKRGTLEAEFTDKVRVAVAAKTPAGGHPVKVNFLSGKEHMQLPDLDNAEGNPLILYFLEREVREMNRVTGGSQNYYRKRIRIALANSAEVKPVSLTIGGKAVQAREIHIAPYRDDPARSRYEKFAEKTFVLTLSEQVPGGVVEMRSELLEAAAGADPTLVVAESVKYVARR